MPLSGCWREWIGCRRRSRSGSRRCGSTPITPRRSTIWGWPCGSRARCSRRCESSPTTPRPQIAWPGYWQLYRRRTVATRFEPLAWAQRACELTYNRVAAYVGTLAIACTAAGRLGEAVATAQRAIELAHDRAGAVGRGDRDAMGTVSQRTRLPLIHRSDQYTPSAMKPELTDRDRTACKTGAFCLCLSA